MRAVEKNNAVKKTNALYLERDTREGSFLKSLHVKSHQHELSGQFAKVECVEFKDLILISIMMFKKSAYSFGQRYVISGRIIRT